MPDGLPVHALFLSETSWTNGGMDRNRGMDSMSNTLMRKKKRSRLRPRQCSLDTWLNPHWARLKGVSLRGSSLQTKSHRNEKTTTTLLGKTRNSENRTQTIK